MDEVQIRTIQKEDNAVLATIVRNTLAEFGANHPGTVYYDPTTDGLFQLFQISGSIYYVALLNDKIVGGGGIFPSVGLPEKTCELVKMYLLPEARGKGLGRKLIELCIEFGKTSGYNQIYIESMPELKKALSVYEQFGFNYLNQPLGNTGHFGCSVWMLKKLEI